MYLRTNVLDGKLRTQFDKPRVNTEVGSRVKQLFEPVVDKNGVVDLEPSGTEDLYASIQSYKDSTDINYILARFTNGEPEVLSQRQGAYGDFTVVPNTYAELLNQVIKGESEFLQLPLDVRSRFNHSFSEWISTAGSDEWYDSMGLSKPVTVSDVPVVEPSATAVVKEIINES